MKALIFLKNRKNRSFVIALSLFLLIVPTHFASAIVSEAVFGLLSWIIYAVVVFVARITVVLVGFLVSIGQYNGFIASPVVLQGWMVLRDISNMFFVLILLLIAFGTILHIEQYQMKRLLPKVLLMAILVNFSKAIAGLLIDFSQVIMLTFVAAYQAAGAGNLAQALNLDKLLSITGTGKANWDSTSMETITALLLALVYVVIASIVVGAFALILVVRMVMLWLLIIFSPLAYVLSVIPIGQKYASQWWENFAKYVILGPVMAFFLWLSLATLPTITTADTDLAARTQSTDAANIADSTAAQTADAAFTAVGSGSVISGFLVSIVMLFASLMFAMQTGGVAGQIAGRAYSEALGKGTLGKVGKKGGGWLLNRLDDMQSRGQKRFMKSRPGQYLANTKFGQRLALEKISEHGIQLRTIPHAWEERSKRVEKERLGESAGVAADIMARAFSWGQRDKTSDSITMRRRMSAEAIKEVTAVSEDQEHVLTEIEDRLEAYTTKDGRKSRRVQRGKEAEVEGLLLQLSKTHDLNEIFKHHELGTTYGLTYTAGNVQQLIKDLFSNGVDENQEAARVAFNVQEVALSASDGFLKGIARMKNGRFEMVNYFEDSVQETAKKNKESPLVAREEVLSEHRESLRQRRRDEVSLENHGVRYEDNMNKAAVDAVVDPEINGLTIPQLIANYNERKQGQTAAAFMAKRTFRNVASQSRFQDFMTEISDGSGRYAGALHLAGEENIRKNGGVLAQQWESVSSETRDALRQNIDHIVKFYEESYDSFSDTEKSNVLSFISAVVKGTRIQDLKNNAVRADEVRAFVDQFSQERLKAVQPINANRRAQGEAQRKAGQPVTVTDIPGITLSEQAPVYNVKRSEIYGNPPVATNRPSTPPPTPSAEPSTPGETPPQPPVDESH